MHIKGAKNVKRMFRLLKGVNRETHYEVHGAGMVGDKLYIDATFVMVPRGLPSCLGMTFRQFAVCTLTEDKKKIAIQEDHWSVHKSDTMQVCFGAISTATSAVKTKVIAAAQDPGVQGGVIGAIVVGDVGGFMGFMAGGMIGLVPAVFTFGLSIPICAVVGGGVGHVTGAVAGGVTGVATGKMIERARRPD